MVKSIFYNVDGTANKESVEKEIFLNCFPTTMHSEVNSLLEKLLWKRKHNSAECFPIKLGEETIHIPYRIYYDEQYPKNLTNKEILVVDCIFTRHHDGHVRERHLKNILKINSSLVTPFIAQLIGEYVIEILAVIKANLSPALIGNLINLKKDNPEFLKKTEDRIQSYWNCYHKRAISKKDYVGFQILHALKEYEECN